MHVLALDTATSHCSAALWSGRLVAERSAHAGQSHSDLVLAMIDAVLTEGGIPLQAIDGIAFGRGPGSFTGLRIACGVAQGLAFAAGVRVLGIDTLLAMAEGAAASRVVCCLDARMNEVYHAAYSRRDETWHAVSAPSVCSPGAVPALTGDGWIACGSGFSAYAGAALGVYDGQLAAVRADAVPHARDIARLAAMEFALGGGVAAEQAAPLYVRDKVALKTDER